MSKSTREDWEADLTPAGTSRPGEYAAEKAVEALHGGRPRPGGARTRPGAYAAEKAVAELHAAEEAHWKASYSEEPYHEPGRPYEYYAHAYRVGYEGGTRHGDKSFEDAEPELKAEYDRQKSDGEPEWHDVKSAVRAAWNRVRHIFSNKD